MRHLVLRLIEPDEIEFFPGQYVDFAVPGTDETRSFSMANTSSRESGQLEFVIKVYPDGAVLPAPGRRAGRRRPARRRSARSGCSRLREGRDSDLVFVGGGAGMAPILSLLRSLAERGQHPQGHVLLRRPDAGATCASRRSCTRSRSTLPDFRFVPALSEPDDDDDWDGEVGLITDVVRTSRDGPGRRRRLRLRAAADGRGGHGRAQRPRAHPRSTSTTTSSPPPVRS